MDVHLILKIVALLFSHSVMSDSLWPHEQQQHTRLPCPSLSPRVCSNSCPSSRWYHPAISSSVVPFSSCPQSLPASESFPMSRLFASGALISPYPNAPWVLLPVHCWQTSNGFKCFAIANYSPWKSFCMYLGTPCKNAGKLPAVELLAQRGRGF